MWRLWSRWIHELEFCAKEDFIFFFASFQELQNLLYSTVQTSIHPCWFFPPREFNECVGKRRRGEKKIHLANLLERETLMKRGEMRDATHKVFPFSKFLSFCRTAYMGNWMEDNFLNAKKIIRKRLSQRSIFSLFEIGGKRNRNSLWKLKCVSLQS